MVRAAMQIDVTGAVLIFDEAHNIEDTARRDALHHVTLLNGTNYILDRV